MTSSKNYELVNIYIFEYFYSKGRFVRLRNFKNFSLEALLENGESQIRKND